MEGGKQRVNVSAQDSAKMLEIIQNKPTRLDTISNSDEIDCLLLRIDISLCLDRLFSSS